MNMDMKRKLLAVLMVLVLLVSLLFIFWFLKEVREDKTYPQEVPSTSTTVSAEEVAKTKKTLDLLTVAPMIEGDYDRKAFGSAWLDVDDNGCDTRNDILKRDLTAVVLEGDCQVIKGDLQDPYTGKLIHFVKGHGSLVDIDHIVALGNVYASGGGILPEETRKSIANDPENLLAVDAPANRAKGDKNAAEWLPPNGSFQCKYVVSQVNVKAKYMLSVTSEEYDAMVKVLEKCN